MKAAQVGCIFLEGLGHLNRKLPRRHEHERLRLLLPEIKF